MPQGRYYVARLFLEKGAYIGQMATYMYVAFCELVGSDFTCALENAAAETVLASILSHILVERCVGIHPSVI